jgi:hypothetical protein
MRRQRAPGLVRAASCTPGATPAPKGRMLAERGVLRQPDEADAAPMIGCPPQDPPRR